MNDFLRSARSVWYRNWPASVENKHVFFFIPRSAKIKKSEYGNTSKKLKKVQLVCTLSLKRETSSYTRKRLIDKNIRAIVVFLYYCVNLRQIETLFCDFAGYETLGDLLLVLFSALISLMDPIINIYFFQISGLPKRYVDQRNLLRNK